MEVMQWPSGTKYSFRGTVVVVVAGANEADKPWNEHRACSGA